MNLDDTSRLAQTDPQNMLAHIDSLPEQLQAAWTLGLSYDLPEWSGIRQVVIAGMGGSAIGGDLLVAYAAPVCKAPIFSQRDYDLPAWASGAHTLVIASSHSGNTEETVSALQAGVARGCRCLVITRGGKLAQLAQEAGLPAWTFQHNGHPRAAVGFSFGLLLAALTRLELSPDPRSELISAIEAMREQQAAIQAQVPATKNLAKRLAGQLVGRWVAVIGAGILSPVARRWKTQINEIAKTWAQFEFLPEADHNTLAGVINPEDQLTRLMALFLRSPSDHPRNRLRSDLTRKIMMIEGLNTDAIEARGQSPLAHLWTCLHLGDYVAYYLAMAYGIDPTPISAIESFKQQLAVAG
jgi:glucose/mannose-6-phosphate isomerase